MANSIFANIELPPAFGWDLIAWSRVEWAFLAFGVVAALIVITAAYFLERAERRSERATVEREMREWVDAIIGDLDAERRQT